MSVCRLVSLSGKLDVLFYSVFVEDKNNYKYSFFSHHIRYFVVYFKNDFSDFSCIQEHQLWLYVLTPHPTFFFQSVDLWLHSCLNTNVSHHFHQLSLLWHFSFPICGRTLQHCLLHRRTNLLIISFSAWICPNWINPVSRCGIHLTPPGFWRTLPPSSSSSWATDCKICWQPWQAR